MQTIRMLSLCAAVLAVGGCATRPTYVAQAPNVTMNCADGLAAMQAVPLKYRVVDADVPYVEFANVARCYRAPDAVNRPVALYRLDGVAPPAELTVSVQLSPGGTFAAAVDVLDGDFKSLRRYDFKDFVRRGSNYSLHAFLNAQGPAPAYVLVAPDDTQVGKNDTVIVPQTDTAFIPVGYGVAAYNSGSESSVVRPFLAGGRIQVTAMAQSAAAFEAK